MRRRNAETSADAGHAASAIDDHPPRTFWLSPHIITNIDRILARLFKWAKPQIDAGDQSPTGPLIIDAVPDGA